MEQYIMINIKTSKINTQDKCKACKYYNPNYSGCLIHVKIDQSLCQDFSNSVEPHFGDVQNIKNIK